ncbi:Acyl-CoA dehydrogenase-like protein [Vibrio crassostreae]|uniref:hypothetical protein n=1 Tax=Vibrio crassostreae TaxID=246167 RepID=UPI0010EC9DB7|nr:hypothetical protein [Vibrio crassostreae]TCN75911.1 acyl-CoA dehydrogenase-like protein [Vibrio crassostreae]CAK2533627.1 Acyl-CoA dehydrogenase-like protein [Vibrio crassostreae]CAK3888881.1 Acyl-CoA dehydrogenase-like protein [Vibrio crassostreae]
MSNYKAVLNNNLSTNIDDLIASYALEDGSETLSNQTIQALQNSPLLRILDESSFNGSGLLSDVVSVCRSLGKIDASLGWLVGVSNSSWSMKANFDLPETVLANMDENSMLSMVLGRPGTLVPHDNGTGWRLSGEWKYASGYPLSSYFFGLAATNEGVVKVVVMPSQDLKITSFWHSTGLLGTQSVTIQASEVIIPESFTVNYQPILHGSLDGRFEGGSYSGYFTGVLMNCLVGTILGATESALEYVVASLQRPIGGSTYTSMRDSGPVRYELGRLKSNLDLLIRAAEYNARVVDHAVGQVSAPLSDKDRVEIRARATQVMKGCTEIVQSLLWIYGSSGLDTSCPLEKIWRDVNVGARHGGFSKFIPEEMIGLTLLNADPVSLSRMF